MSGNIRSSTKETWVLLLSWCTLFIAFWNYRVSWFLIAYFNLSLATHIPDEKFFLSGNFWCSTEKAAILLLSWITLYIPFSLYKMSWTSCLNSMFKTYLLLNFVCSAKEASMFFFLKCLDFWLLILLCHELPISCKTFIFPVF